MNEEIVVRIGDKGAIEVEVNGHVGPTCANITRALEKALGTVTGEVKKPEFNHRAKQGQGVQAGAR